MQCMPLTIICASLARKCFPECPNEGIFLTEKHQVKLLKIYKYPMNMILHLIKMPSEMRT